MFIAMNVIPLRGTKVPENKTFELNEFGNAERLADAVKGKFVYCAALGGWLENDGQQYRPVDKAAIRGAAISVVNSMSDDPSKSDGDYVALMRWQQRSKKNNAINSMITLAQAPPLACRAEMFDDDPDLLNVQNGVYDLHRDQFRERTATDFFMRCAAVDYVEGAECPKWVQFLETVFCGDKDVIRYVQKLSGYLLNGSTSDQKFYNLLGGGSNGKSTFLNVLKEMLGDYAMVVPADALLMNRNAGGPTPYITDLKGKRLVYVSEFNEEARLDEAKIKSLTGSEPITGNAKYKDPITFIPEFKLFVATNHPLRIEGTDDGIWRRTCVIPFNHQFKGANRKDDYDKTLLKERSGILNWMLEGHRRYKAEGLDLPSTIIKMVAAYREEQDAVGRFLKTCTAECSTSFVLLKMLYEQYEQWCKDEGIFPLKKPSFTNDLRRRGFIVKPKTANKRYVFGLRLVT